MIFAAQWSMGGGSALHATIHAFVQSGWQQVGSGNGGGAPDNRYSPAITFSTVGASVVTSMERARGKAAPGAGTGFRNRHWTSAFANSRHQPMSFKSNGNDRTLIADFGAFSLSGQAANLLRSARLVASQGSFALAGQAAGLVASRKLVADVGTFALAGQAVTLLKGRNLTADGGVFSLTGQAAGLRAAKLLSASPGSFVLSGQAARLLAQRLLAAGSGAFALAGQDAQLRVVRVMVAGHAVYILTGQSVELRASRLLLADAGLFVLTGQAAALDADVDVVEAVARGKYAPEHAAALIELGAATGFSSENAFARAALAEAGV